jgi:hypothetical protein
VNWTSQNVDVLIDMLDDPVRRWFAAWALGTLLKEAGPITAEQAGRLAESIDAPQLSNEVYVMGDVERTLRDVYTAEKPAQIDRYFDARDLELPQEPQQCWLVGHCIFETREAAQAYLDMRAWLELDKESGS